MPPTPRAKSPFALNPLFKLLVLINTLLCVTTLTVMIWPAADPSDPMLKGKERLFNACEHVFTLTAGAFIGLLGGRAAAPDPSRPPPP